MTPPTVARAAPASVPAVRRRGLPGAAALRTAAAAVSGVLAYVAFPPLGAWYAAPVAVAGLALAVRGRRPRAAFGLATVFGLAFLVPLLSWIATLGVDVWLGLALAEALLVGLLGVALALVQRLPAWPVWVAAAWVADEALRARVPLGGFPWGRLAFAEADGPLVRYAAVGGAPLVGFVVAGTGALTAWLALVAAAGWRGRGERPARAAARRAAVPAGVLAGAVAAVIGAALVVPVPTAGQDRGGPPSAVVAAVQGNVPRLGLDAFAQRNAVIRNHVAATHAFAADVRAGRRPPPDVVLWPENATDVDPRHDAGVGALIGAAVADVGVPTLVGAVLDGPGPDHVSNAGLVWVPGAAPRVGYVKRKLVPFGEYVPYRARLEPLIGRLSRIPRDFARGSGAGVVQLGPVRLSDVICYEVAYDGLVREDVRGGGRLIVVQTNNATYGAGETRQQLAMARLRAVEHGRAVAVVATSGISALIAPDGRLLAQSGIFTRDVLERTLPLRDSITPADRLGPWPEAVIALAGLLAACVAAITRRRGRGAA